MLAVIFKGVDLEVCVIFNWRSPLSDCKFKSEMGEKCWG